MIKAQKTRRKFYNKWLYKVTLKLQGAALLRIYSSEEIDKFVNLPSVSTSLSSYSLWKQKAWANRRDIKSLTSLLRQYGDENWTQRVESNNIDLYTNDEDLYNKLITRFSGILVHHFAPDKDKLDILEERNGKTMIVKKLPQNRFNYRVYLQPHKITDSDDKVKYLKWLEGQMPRVTCTPAIKKWFLSTSVNWDRRYILVQDDPTLMMLKLRNSDVVGTVYKFEVA